MVDSRSLILALTLEGSSGADPRYVRFRRRKSAYVATQVLRPDEYELLGFIDTDDGVDLLWQCTGQTRIKRPAEG